MGFGCAVPSRPKSQFYYVSNNAGYVAIANVIRVRIATAASPWLLPELRVKRVGDIGPQADGHSAAAIDKARRNSTKNIMCDIIAINCFGDQSCAFLIIINRVKVTWLSTKSRYKVPVANATEFKSVAFNHFRTTDYGVCFKRPVHAPGTYIYWCVEVPRS